MRLAILLAVPVFTNGTCQSCQPAPAPAEQAPCASYDGQGDLDAIAESPRFNELAEKLTIEMAGGFTADWDVYSRVEVDTFRLEDLYPEDLLVARSHGDAVVLVPDRPTLTLIEEGLYGGWDCPNERYGYTGHTYDGDRVVVLFHGIYDDDALAEEYEWLEGIEHAFPLDASKDVGAPRMEVCGEIDGETYHYVLHRFVDGAVDTRFYYTSEPDGTLTYGGTWQLGDPLPEWPTRCW